MNVLYLSKTAILLELVNAFNSGATRQVNIDPSMGIEVAKQLLESWTKESDEYFRKTKD